MDLNDYVKFFDGKAKEFDRFCLQFLTRQATRVINIAKDRTPVDTGFLRSSWELDSVYKDKNGYYADITNGADYASEVEYGTDWREPRNMITVPLNNYNNKVEDIFKQALKRYMAKGFK